MKKFLIGLLISAAAIPSAYAWGDREQGALAGLIVGSMIHNNSHRQWYPSHYHAPRYVHPGFVAPIAAAPVYYYVQPQVVVIQDNCKRVPVYDQNNQIVAFTQVCNNQVTQ